MKDKPKHISGRWIGCPIEEEFFGEERKQGKRQRKIISAKDRSQYKKTDRNKFEKSKELHQESKFSREDLAQGRVLSIMSQGIIVENEGKIFNCILRGVLKKDKGLAKNLVTVGDLVLFEKSSESEGTIAHIEPRKTVLSRADNLSRRKEQLIASNIDQVLITSSVFSPPLKPFLIDRYIIATDKGNMQPIIVINKIDLLESSDPLVEEEKQLYQEVCTTYKKLGIPLIALSVTTGEGLDELRQAMKDKVSVFSGQSGVGKTSLINAVTGLDLRTGKTVDRTKKGSHTTTSANLLPLSFGGWCVDTPGIKSFGVWDLKRDEIEQYFSEIYEIGHSCKYPDCLHLHENDCAVLRAVEEGIISLMRYQSFQALMEGAIHEHFRR